MENENNHIERIDLTNLDGDGFNRILAGLKKAFPNRLGKKKHSPSTPYWFIQIKTSWNNNAIIHYEVIYDAYSNGMKYADEGVRVEMHFEGYDKNRKKANDIYEYLKQGTAVFGLSWKEWAPYRCIIADKIDTYQGIVDGFYKSIEIFDNLITQYIMIEHYIELLEGNSNLVLTGVPGTGKTYLAKQVAERMIFSKTPNIGEMNESEKQKFFNERYGFVQFHPSYDYTDFVEGLRPTKPNDNGNIGFELREGVFKEFCEKASKDTENNYVFVIDEINRGDISKIFGELFFSIDPGYRGADGTFKTKNGERFYVPKNVYIIGTMNDIDRSVESMDFAMRRRFTWQEVTAEDSARNMGLSKKEQSIMKSLNDKIENTEGLNSSFHVGGAYFIDANGNYDDIWETRLAPLLREYLRGVPDVEKAVDEELKNAYNEYKNEKCDGDLNGFSEPFKARDLFKELFKKPHNRIWKQGNYHYEEDYWYLQIKTIWDEDIDIHYEVIYDVTKHGGSYKDERLRIELHLEGKYKEKNYDEFCEYLKKESGQDASLKWESWKDEGRDENGRCKYCKKGITNFDDIVEGIEYLMNIFDPLLAKYEPEMLKMRLEKAHNLILTGAPGTGKTFMAKQIARRLIENDDVENNEQYGFVQFHPSYDYTDFVEGLRPTTPNDDGSIGFELRPGVFKEFCEKASKNKDKNYVFVIDEINRGDISKIFGELFFSIDPGYRGKKGAVNTQYANMHEDDEKFYVPENVYILGTMNDIDRSVESMDFALRRRFVWKEIKAKDTQQMLDDLGDDKKMEGKHKMDSDGIQKAKYRMDNLNNKISDKDEIGLNSAYHIGASYFMKLANYGGTNGERFEKLWKNHLEGVLREYLRGDENVKGKIDKLREAFDNVQSPEGHNPENGNDGGGVSAAE